MGVRAKSEELFNIVAAEITVIPEGRQFHEVDLWSGDPSEGRRQLRTARRVAKLISHEFGYEASPILVPAHSENGDLRTFIYVSRVV